MTWDKAVLQAIEELAKTGDRNRDMCLALLLRAGALTTEIKGCADCKPSSPLEPVRSEPGSGQ